MNRDKVIDETRAKSGSSWDTFNDIVQDYPLQLEYDKVKGLCLIASRTIETGEIILKETPLSMAIESSYLMDYCSTCACLLSQEDREDWTQTISPLCMSCHYNNHLLDEHVKFSQIELKSDNDETGLYALLLRYFGQYSVGRYAAMEDDVICADFDNAEWLDQDDGPFTEELNQDIKTIAQYIRSNQSPAGKQFKQQEIEHLCKIIVCNQHAVGGKDGDIGRAFYPIAALLNHSCKPNSEWQTNYKNKTVMEIKTVLRVDQGEELTISYVPKEVLQAKDRKDLIKTLRQFDCQCEQCHHL